VADQGRRWMAVWLGWSLGWSLGWTCTGHTTTGELHLIIVIHWI
jgi:hypothetical protein